MVNLGKKMVLSRLIVEYQDTKNCSSPEGHIETSIDGQKWNISEELIPTTQIGNRNMLELGRLTYFFPAVETSYIKIVMTDIKSCFFNNPSAELFILE